MMGAYESRVAGYVAKVAAAAGCSPSFGFDLAATPDNEFCAVIKDFKNLINDVSTRLFRLVALWPSCVGDRGWWMRSASKWTPPFAPSSRRSCSRLLHPPAAMLGCISG